MPHRELEEYFLEIWGEQVGPGLYLCPKGKVDLSDEWTCTLESYKSRRHK